MKILLSFDVEEFDIPTEFGQQIPEQDYYDVSARGMRRVLDVLKKHEIDATCFTTANFALHEKDLVLEISERCEIASHGYWHSQFEEGDLLKSKLELEKLTNQEVVGFRRARFAKTSQEAIQAAGYLYNSSENPIWMPGRYNNFLKKRTAYYSGPILNIPISASPAIRIPLFWLAIKNFPQWLIRYASWQTLMCDGYLNIFFHPWEFADISGYGLPRYIRGRCGDEMLERFEWYVQWLKQYGRFQCMRDFVRQYS